VVTLTRSVAVFDIDLPPGVAFLRSLGRAGVPLVAYSVDGRAAGRYSRFAGRMRACPSVRRIDELVEFLVDGITDGRIDLIAPTSDYVAFAVAAAVDKLGIDAATLGHPDPEAVRTVLFKDRFYAQASRLGFPIPPYSTPGDAAEALAWADETGYPVVLKPRTHAGIGLRRGVVIGHADALAASFRPWPLRPGNDAVQRYETDLALPIVQRYYELGTMDVVSVTGYLACDGSLRGLGHARKVSQSPRRLGVGTMFEPIDAQPFTDQAVEVVRTILGTGIFEFEVIVDRATGGPRAVDLNPRGFGQMSLDIGRGNNLPLLWYNDVAGTSVSSPGPRRHARLWHDALGSYTAFLVRLLRGPNRRSIAHRGWLRFKAPTVGAMHEWSDPLPGVRFVLDHLRHPRAFVRPFLMDSEMRGRDLRPQVLEDPGHRDSEP
jgi:predicted ATP-grasp superfamily ATP-dependent carboligase